DHLPLFNKFRVPVMAIVLFQVATALGLAWGWSAVLDRGARKGESAVWLDRLLLALGAVLALALVVGVLGQDMWREGYVALATRIKSTGAQPFPNELAELAYRAYVVDLGRACVLGLVAVALAWLAARGRFGATLATTGVLALLLIELWPV